MPELMEEYHFPIPIMRSLQSEFPEMPMQVGDIS